MGNATHTHRPTVAAAICLLVALLFVAAGCTKHKEEPKPEAEEGPMSGTMLEGKSVLMIVAKQNFRDEELAEPRAVLRQAGAKVTIAASALRESVGMLGLERVTPEITLEEVDPTAYDAIIFVGGQGASEYWNDKTAHRIATQAHEAGKVVAAICIAPVTLANAGLLKGRKATVYRSEKGALVKGGASYTGAAVEVDGLIITADGPTSAAEFGEAIRDALAGE